MREQSFTAFLMQKLGRSFFIEICKKIGKSELATAIALYLLYTDKGPSADVVHVQLQIGQQASIVFNVAHQMVGCHWH